jgi:hypothetical protein
LYKRSRSVSQGRNKNGSREKSNRDSQENENG